MDGHVLWLTGGAGVLALIFAVLAVRRIGAMEVKIERVRELSEIIHRGAMTFLYREYKALVPFVLLVGVLLAWKASFPLAVSFVLGAFCSALAGFLGMRVATRANGKTAYAATVGMNQALRVAFTGGVVMGMFVVGIGVLGVVLVYRLYGDPSVITG
ncbi:MAG TPA: sodium/proton-translocating pyrophosphatase, partial [Thermosynergistes sp.]|nr:sodium/proton-translocating pyrophosphatase [Thermosynergistes sp.]